MIGQLEVTHALSLRNHSVVNALEGHIEKLGCRAVVAQLLPMEIANGRTLCFQAWPVVRSQFVSTQSRGKPNAEQHPILGLM